MIHINNKAGWKKQFTVAASVLRVKTNLTESSFKRARKELEEKGYISVLSRGGNQAPIYQLTSLSSILDHSTDDRADQTVSSTTNQDAVRKMAPLNKQKETRPKQNNQTPTTNSAAVFYKENLGSLPPYILAELQNWIAS
ncbi:hypothetical protein [Aquibacillus albus]|uniref:Uncharacterized protein n=1 Tax=Aquibacillus albus TaxID=1168171 RepID=A0ABS2MZU7_9BACI|nr:hypothetical protein [Aquibacillus albus]MBM7571392.1 hypothetical protein [Aquibacillus albus]